MSLAGGAITTASGVTMIGYWLVEIFGPAHHNPYLGIIFFLILPFLFILGLALIPIGIFLRHRKLARAGELPVEYPRVDLNDPIFRHGLDIVMVATVVNLLSPDGSFLLMMAISMVAPMFTWFMIFVTHLYFRRRYRGEALAFRMWGYPATSLLGAALMLGALLTTAFTSAFRMTLVCGVPFLLALTLAYRFWGRGRIRQLRAEGEALG